MQWSVGGNKPGVLMSKRIVVVCAAVKVYSRQTLQLTFANILSVPRRQGVSADFFTLSAIKQSGQAVTVPARRGTYGSIDTAAWDLTHFKERFYIASCSVHLIGTEVN